MKLLFTEEELELRGPLYRTRSPSARPNTVPQPRPPILIAGGGPTILELPSVRPRSWRSPADAGVKPPAPETDCEGVRGQMTSSFAAGSRSGRSTEASYVTLTGDREKPRRDRREWKSTRAWSIVDLSRDRELDSGREKHFGSARDRHSTFACAAPRRGARPVVKTFVLSARRQPRLDRADIVIVAFILSGPDRVLQGIRSSLPR